jgi:hypothetical protein
MQTWKEGNDRTGNGRNVFPVDPLIAPTTLGAGEWVEFTDGSIRRIRKIEQTIGYGAQGDRYMVVSTILFDADETMWRGDRPAKAKKAAST